MSDARPNYPAVASGGVLTLVTALPVFLTGALSVEIGRQLDFSSSVLGIATAAYFVCSASFSPIGGRIVERRGANVGMRMVGVLACTASLVVGFAPHASVVVAGLAIAGLAAGMVGPSVNTMLAGAIPPGQQGLAFGIKQSAVPMSTLLGGLALPLIALRFGWRPSFFIAAGLAVVAFLTSATGDGAGRAPARSADRRGRDPTVLVLAAGAAGGAAAGSATGAFAVPAVIEAGLSEGTAGVVAAMGAAGAISVRVGAGYITDRSSRAPLSIVATLLALGCVAMVVMSGATATLAGVAIIGAFAGGWGWPGLQQHAVVQAYAHRPASATGVTQAGAFTGGALGPLGFGLLVDAASYTVAWLYLAGCAGFGAAMAYWAYRRMPTAGLALSARPEVPNLDPGRQN